MTNGEIIALVIVAILGAVAGRLVVRALFNKALGGTMFGGNFL